MGLLYRMGSFGIVSRKKLSGTCPSLTVFPRGSGMLNLATVNAADEFWVFGGRGGGNSFPPLPSSPPKSNPQKKTKNKKKEKINK